MEEQRIGFMYFNLFKSWLARIWDGMFPRGFRRSRALPILVVSLAVLLPLGVWRLHRAGKFGMLKREIKGENQPPTVQGPMPGGMEPIFLKRGQTSAGNMPEFRSATLLPGLGMDVLQIVAYIPGRGEVPLLAGPTLKEVAEGNTPLRVGPNDRWGALEAPWSGVLAGLLTPVGTTFRTVWKGHMIEVPVNVVGRGTAEGGLLNTLAADSTQVLPTVDGTSATALYKAADFDQHWLSQTDVTVVVTLGARTLDLTVTARNVGEQPEPMGIGWHPRFLIPSQIRDNAEIRLPSGEELEIADRAKGLPSGKFVPAGLALSRYQIRPASLGIGSIDGSLVRLKAGLMDAGVSAEIRDPASQVGLRMTALNDNIRQLRITSPGGSNYVGIGMQTNLDDPFGKEWIGADPQTIPVLLPGQTAEWKIKLEIFGISGTPH